MKKTLGVFGVVLACAGLALAQTRSDTADAATAAVSSVHCDFDSQAVPSCFACVRVTVVTDTGAGTRTAQQEYCGRPRVMRAAANINRATNLAAALVPGALRANGFEAVDAGAL
jgi:hypothetical protein